MKRFCVTVIIITLYAAFCAPQANSGAEKAGPTPKKEVETTYSRVDRRNRGDEEVFPAGLIKFEDADLLQVLGVYEDLSGRTVIRANSLPPTKISVKNRLPLTRIEALQTLDSALAQNSITMIPQGTKFVKAVAAAQAGQEAAPVLDWPAYQLPDCGTYIQYMIEVKHCRPRDIVPALQPFAKMPQSILAVDANDLIILRDYSSNIRRMLQMIERLDKKSKRAAEEEKSS